MKISKIFAGLSAAAIMASMAATVPASAAKYNLYTLGFNIQVGHVKNARLTIKAISSDNTIWNGEEGVSEGYMYTVQKSWNQDSPKDDVVSDIPYNYDEDGNIKQAKGAGFINDMDTGPTKYNGEWAQVTLTDDDLSKITIEVSFVADSNSKWEYHSFIAQDGKLYPIKEVDGAKVADTEVPDEKLVASEYQVFCLAGGDSQSFPFETVSVDEINSQFGGSLTDGTIESDDVSNNGYYNASYEATYTYNASELASGTFEVAEAGEWSDGADESKADESKADNSKADNSSSGGGSGSGDSNSKADTSSAAADGSSASDTSSAADGVDAGSTGTANAGSSDSSSSSTAAASASSSSSTAAASADSKSSTSSTSASTTKSSTTTTTSSNAAAPAGGGSDGSAESDATSNAASGAAAGVGLAITAVAAAAIVVSKRRN